MRVSAFVGPVVAVVVLAYRAVIRAEMEIPYRTFLLDLGRRM
jgi:hypothetical protein